MIRCLKDFKGTDNQGYGVEIYGGKHYNTPDGEFAELNHGQEYSIKVVNYNSHYCRVNLDIDGHNQGVWNFSPQMEAKLERPATIAKKFTFYRVKYAPTSSGIEKGKAENGLVSCTFTPERDADMIEFRVTLLGNEAPGANFKMFGKATYSDFVTKIKIISRDIFQTDCIANKVTILWESDDPHAVAQYIMNLSDESKMYKDYLCERGFIEGITYNISVVPEIKCVHFNCKDKAFDYNVLSNCTAKDLIDVAKEKCGITAFYIILDDGTPIIHSEWDIKVLSNPIFRLLSNREISVMSKTGVLNVKVSEELPSSSDFFPVKVKTTFGKTYEILINENTTVYAMKMKLHFLVGVAPENMRLGDEENSDMYNDERACDYPDLTKLKQLQLFLPMRGGGRGSSLDIKTTSPFKESGSKSLSTMDPSWRAGATTLGKKSDQEFDTGPQLIVDETKAVTLTVRLVARENEMSEEEKFKDADCTPLAVPSQVPD